MSSLRQDRDNPRTALVKLRKRVDDLLSFVLNESETTEQASEKISTLYDETEHRTLLLQIEDIRTTHDAQTALNDVVTNSAMDAAVESVKESFAATLSHLQKLQEILLGFVDSVETLHEHVESPPSISERDWEAERKFAAFVRMSQRNRPSPSREPESAQKELPEPGQKPAEDAVLADAIAVDRVADVVTHVRQKKSEGSMSLSHPSMQKKGKQLERHVQKLKLQLAKDSTTSDEALRNLAPSKGCN
jgi:hypothetical protein